MKSLHRYLMQHVISMVLLVSVVLLAIQIFVLFINEFSSIGKGDYHAVQALRHVILRLPHELNDLFPVVCLLGGLLGLGLLASNSELTVMRASGFSKNDVTKSIVLTAVILSAGMLLLGEVAGPILLHLAHNKKALETSQGQALRSREGIWLREGRRFVHIDKVVSPQVLQNVRQYHFDENHSLIQASRADRALYSSENWFLRNMNVSEFLKGGIRKSNSKQQRWSLSVTPAFLANASLDPEEMSLPNLFGFIKLQRQNQQSVLYYELSFWQRLLQPLTIIVMLLLAIPFIFNAHYRTTMGARILLGLSVGFIFYMVNRFLGPICLVYQWPPILAAILPTLLFVLLGVSMTRLGEHP